MTSESMLSFLYEPTTCLLITTVVLAVIVMIVSGILWLWAKQHSWQSEFLRQVARIAGTTFFVALTFLVLGGIGLLIF